MDKIILETRGVSTRVYINDLEIHPCEGYFYHKGGEIPKLYLTFNATDLHMEFYGVDQTMYDVDRAIEEMEDDMEERQIELEDIFRPEED